jgi:hypothetical protein
VKELKPEYFLLDYIISDLVTGKGHNPCFFSFCHQKHSKEITELLAFHRHAEKSHGFCCNL